MSSDLDTLRDTLKEAVTDLAKTHAHFYWVADASTTDLVSHVFARHGLTVSGNPAFVRRFHASLHAEELV